MVSPRGRRRPLPDRRHLVADGDGRHPDHAAARRHPAQARLRDAAVLRREAAGGGCGRQGVEGAAEGNLVIADSWPGQMRTVYGDHERFGMTYFSTYPGKILHRRRLPPRCGRLLLDHRPRGRRDQRTGHRMGTAEVESALVAHPKVSEAAVVGYPHDIKGQGIYAYVTLMAGVEPRRTAQGARHLGAQGDRPDRLAGPDPFAPACPRPVPARSCAAHPAQDRRGQFGNLGDTLDLDRRGRGPRGKPPEQAGPDA